MADTPGDPKSAEWAGWDTMLHTIGERSGPSARATKRMLAQNFSLEREQTVAVANLSNPLIRGLSTYFLQEQLLGNIHQQIVVDEANAFPVEKIVDHREDTKGEVEYLVRFKGCGPEDDAWYPGRDVKDEQCVGGFEAIQAYGANSGVPPRPATVPKPPSAVAQRRPSTAPLRPITQPHKTTPMRPRSQGLIIAASVHDTPPPQPAASCMVDSHRPAAASWFMTMYANRAFTNPTLAPPNETAEDRQRRLQQRLPLTGYDPQDVKVIPAEAGGRHTFRVTVGGRRMTIYADTLATSLMPSVQLRSACLVRLLGSLKPSGKRRGGAVEKKKRGKE